MFAISKSLTHTFCILINCRIIYTYLYGLYSSPVSIKLFIQEFERKLYQKIEIDNQKRSYEYVIRREIQKLKNFMETGEEYKPYKYV